MHRTMLQLDEPLYGRLKNEAFEKGVSLSALVRELLSKALGLAGRRKKKMLISQFKFIGCGRSREKLDAEKHDEYLAEDFLK